jgi:hypothetical protein
MEKLPMDDSLRIMTQYATFFAIEARCAALDAITGPAEWQMEYASILAAIHEHRYGQQELPDLAVAYARLTAFTQAHIPPTTRDIWEELRHV